MRHKKNRRVKAFTLTEKSAAVLAIRMVALAMHMLADQVAMGETTPHDAAARIKRAMQEIAKLGRKGKNRGKA